MSETDEMDLAREEYLAKVRRLARALGKKESVVRKMLNAEAARKLFENSELLQKWERETFPDSDDH